MPHAIFHRAEDVSQDDEDGYDIKHIDESLPRDVDIGLGVATGLVSPMKRKGRGHIDTKHDNLEYETSKNNIFARLRVARARSARALDKKAGTACLHQETEAVTENKESSKPSRGDSRVLLAVNGDDDAAQRHVKRGCEEDGG